MVSVKRKWTVLFFFLFLFGPFAPQLRAQALPDPPWHLVDIWYKLSEPVPFRSLSIDLEIAGEIPENLSLYIAPFGLGEFNRVPFYGGIQNSAEFSHPKTGEKLPYRRIGIFSRWNERDLRFTRTETDGWNESGGYEGDFISVRAPFFWKAGHYRFILSAVEKGPLKSPEGTWVEMFILVQNTGQLRRIGALKFPGDSLMLKEDFASFVEIFGDRIPPAKYPRLTLVFSNFQLNGKAWNLREISAVYPDDVPQIAHAKREAGKIVVRLGAEADGNRPKEIRWTE